MEEQSHRFASHLQQKKGNTNDAIMTALKSILPKDSQNGYLPAPPKAVHFSLTRHIKKVMLCYLGLKLGGCQVKLSMVCPRSKDYVFRCYRAVAV